MLILDTVLQSDQESASKPRAHGQPLMANDVNESYTAATAQRVTAISVGPAPFFYFASVLTPYSPQITTTL